MTGQRFSAAAAIIAGLCFIAALHFADRVLSGFLQCEAARACPWTTDIGGRP